VSVTRGVPAPGGDKGVSFASSDDFIESLSSVPQVLTGNPAFTIEAVVLIPRDATVALWPPFLHWGAGGTTHELYFSLQHDDRRRIYAGFYNSGLRTAINIPLGGWIHIAMVREAGGNASTGTTVYINGLEVPVERDPDLGGTLTPELVATPLRINRGLDFIRYFTGKMDELALYDRALPAVEIAAHFQAMPKISYDDWARANFGASSPDFAVRSARGADPDSDGFTNEAEYCAGTNPELAASLPFIDPFLIYGGPHPVPALRVTWNLKAAGNSLGLESCMALQAPWAPVASPFTNRVVSFFEGDGSSALRTVLPAIDPALIAYPWFLRAQFATR
jgi:hypothetical protein